ncbi:hypothetical protein SOVF_067960 [Spinacia oleracea]|uniref:Probable disease resistance protein At5g43730 n=1 Tax=Spinacia oleracea TaxID=3562 RepID=A0ABM3QPB4_SPIOL|nr:probable disease resistance protein At5g43730 [Spinacia oleracea]KNA18743.1 hypothetical protein SOVF_067960 [Spinacia oleracea]
MNSFPVLLDTVSFLDILIKAESFVDGKRILEGKADYLRAKIEDVEGALFSASIQHGKKRKRDEDLFFWATKGRELVQVARSLLGHDGPEKKRKVEEQSISYLQACAKLVKFHKLMKTLSDHEEEVDVLLSCPISDEQGPGRGNFIPVRELFGHVASDSLEQLLALLRGVEIGRIAIHGEIGIGKTFLMKHLHNSVLKWEERFDCVIWVTCPHQFSIEGVQDAIAAAVKCELCSDDDVNKRAEILSDTLSGLGSFVLFLDDVPESQFCPVEIGILVPAEGSKSKLVLTTRSALVSEKLGCFRKVHLDRLSDEEACELLLNEAGISGRSASLLKGIPNLLAKKCCGVPLMITDIATRMCGIDDIREWRNALFEFGKS